MNSIPPLRKPTSAMSWLGFGITLFVLILVWIVNIIVFSHIGDHDFPIGSFYMLLFMCGGFLGLLGLIFSIVGLVQAIRNFTPKWMGICGVVFCCLSVLSVFAPIVAIGFINNQTVETEVYDNEESNEILSDNADVVLKITSSNILKCYDNRNGQDQNPATIRAYSPNLEHELSTWMKMQGINGSNATIRIASDKDVDYSEVVNVINALNSMGIKRFGTK